MWKHEEAVNFSGVTMRLNPEKQQDGKLDEGYHAGNSFHALLNIFHQI